MTASMVLSGCATDRLDATYLLEDGHVGVDMLDGALPEGTRDGAPDAPQDRGSGDTGVTDHCNGTYGAVPFKVDSLFPVLWICSGASCASPAPSPYFYPVTNPDCNQLIPDGGVVPPFSDGGTPPDAGSGAPTPNSCHEFVFNPNCPTPGACWAGVIFAQSIDGPAAPGVCIELGATTVTFSAKASRPHAIVKFGSIREGLNQTEFYIPIGTVWADYSISIPAGEPYNNYSSDQTGVWYGFSVILEPESHPGGTYIFVRDMTWVK